MKILIAGYWGWHQYEEAFSIALKELGHEIVPFKTSIYFDTFLGKQQQVIPIPGFSLLRLNSDLLKKIKSENPTLFLAWRCTHILPSTIKKINLMGIKTATYNNDDPFGPSSHGNVPFHHHFLWHWYLKSIKIANFNFFYRKINVEEARIIGAKNCNVMMPYFIPWKDHHVKLNIQEKIKFESDLVFVGHYEADKRVNYLKSLVNAGFHVRLFGGEYWTKDALGYLYNYFAPIIPANEQNYTKALCGSKICIVFLSKINRDTYTRRCFEIPACMNVMLAERTQDLMDMFEEDKEACYFSSEEEMVEKAKWLIDNPEIRIQIANNAFKRVWKDGHDIKSRAEQFIQICTTK